jgi:hypothetical protein
MSIDKKVNYDVQGGVKNYLGKQQQVKAPLKWKSSPDSPETELAYITKAEKDLLIKQDLHGSLQGGVNRGPSGIMSLDGYGSYDDPSDPGRDTGMSGAATSAAESGRNTSDTMAEGASYKDVQDYQAASVAAGAGQRVNPGFFDSRNTVSPDVLQRAKAFAPEAYKANRSSGLMGFISSGGLLGNVVRGIGQKMGLGKKFDQPTYDMSGYNSLGLGGTGQEGFGVPTQQGDYDVLGNKINEITGEIVSPTGQSLGFLDDYPGQKKGIETIVPVTGGSDDYVKLVEKFLPVSTMPEDEDLLGGFTSRYLPDKTEEEKELKKEIEKMINKKFKNFGGFGDIELTGDETP